MGETSNKDFISGNKIRYEKLVKNEIDFFFYCWTVKKMKLSSWKAMFACIHLFKRFLLKLKIMFFLEQSVK